MATVKLGARPETFKPFPVKFTMPDGSEGAITATFKYRTRAEFATLLNATNKSNPELPKQADGSLDFEALHADTIKRNAQHMFEALKSWDLEEELTLDNLIVMGTGLPAAMQALANAYQAACVEGRLGN